MRFDHDVFTNSAFTPSDFAGRAGAQCAARDDFVEARRGGGGLRTVGGGTGGLARGARAQQRGANNRQAEGGFFHRVSRSGFD